MCQMNSGAEAGNLLILIADVATPSRVR